MRLIYDIETFFDLFCAGFYDPETGNYWLFEVSSRRNQALEMIEFLVWCMHNDVKLVGYNNLGFDYPVLHHLWLLVEASGTFEAIDAHRKANAIIHSTNRFEHNVKPWEIRIPQIDLFKVHHFDNRARSTSLKKLEINMRSANVVDLPYPPDQPLTDAQKDEVIAYMGHDIGETAKFWVHSKPAIDFREELAGTYPNLGDVLNFNDTKIGKKFFEMRLEEAGTACYDKRTGRKEPIQTIRDRIDIGQIISDKVMFRHPEFLRVKDWLANQSIRPDQTKGFLSEGDGGHGLSANIDGFGYHFGSGGIHGSLNRIAIHEDDEFEVWDWDVASYYPNLAITHRFYPDHLSETFCDVYQNMFETRREYAKGTAENAIYKLALNGVYGDSNNVYSPFYDPQYTMAVTINGQLLLCMLAEWLTYSWDDMKPLHEHVSLIQINTDGLTIKVRKSYVEWMNAVCKAWENHTGLVLESARYKSMFIRDVNNYLAVTTEGKIKRKGAYCYETPLDNPFTGEVGWHKDHSKLVVPKAAEAHMVHGTPIDEFVKNHQDAWDFVCSVKVPRSARLEANGQRVQGTSRYYLSTDGVDLVKVMAPLKGKTDERRIGIEAGWTATLVNDISDWRWDNVNWHYYIEETRKLII